MGRCWPKKWSKMGIFHLFWTRFGPGYPGPRPGSGRPNFEALVRLTKSSNNFFLQKREQIQERCFLVPHRPKMRCLCITFSTLKKKLAYMETLYICCCWFFFEKDIPFPKFMIKKLVYYNAFMHKVLENVFWCTASLKSLGLRSCDRGTHWTK